MRRGASKDFDHWRRYAKPTLAIAPLLACLFFAVAATPGYCRDDNSLSRPATDEGPTAVRLGIYLADVFEISASDQSFQADVVVTAEWFDSRMVGRWSEVHGMALVDVWHPNLQLLNRRAVTAILPSRVEVNPSGRVRWQQRWIGWFSARMDLRDFPLDHQRFRVQIVSVGYTPNEVALTVNSENVPSGRSPDFSVTEWAVGPTQAEIANFTPAPGAKTLAGAQLWWEAQRYIGYQAVQVIFPLVLIVLMGSAAFWVDPSVVPARLSVAMTTMLTLIAYRFALGRSVPNLTYLTRFDFFMLASTLLTFLTLLFVAVGALLVARGHGSNVQQMDKWARVIFPAVFGLVFLLVWWS